MNSLSDICFLNLFPANTHHSNTDEKQNICKTRAQTVSRSSECGQQTVPEQVICLNEAVLT